MAPLIHSIIEYSHIMYRSRPSSKHKCKSHVKVTASHDILCCNVLAAHVLDRQIFVNNDWYMSAIYCSNTIVKEGRESRILQSMMGLTETWVPWCDDVCS